MVYGFLKAVQNPAQVGEKGTFRFPKSRPRGAVKPVSIPLPPATCGGTEHTCTCTNVSLIWSSSVGREDCAVFLWVFDARLANQCKGWNMLACCIFG